MSPGVLFLSRIPANLLHPKLPTTSFARAAPFPLARLLAKAALIATHRPCRVRVRFPQPPPRYPERPIGKDRL